MSLNTSNTWIEIATIDELKNTNKIKKKLADDLEILIIKIGNAIFCIENKCSHDEKSLEDGNINESKKTIECSHHGAIFDLETGKALRMPAVTPINIFKTKIENNKIYILF
ncbi:MAG: Rieske 2Fe-2S domain-containing protein [bacterium]|nr:Rieske 2Fe-2S domain-containing protein [bacterium]